MHLINLQKSLQALELALRQDMELGGLLQKAREIVSALRLEAELIGEEELAQGAGQVLAYLETVLEGRLELDETGTGTVLDFVIFFKDALTDATLKVQAANSRELREWNERYQNLMARMKPIEEEIIAREVSEVQENKEELEAIEPVLELSDADEEANAVSVPGEEMQSAQEVVLEEQDADSTDAQTAAGIAERVEEASQAEEVVEEVQLMESAPENMAADVVIPDAETKSARELLESLEPLVSPASALDQEIVIAGGNGFKSKRNGDSPVRIPVQLEEVERLKKKLLQLHEKQEILSSKMSGILGDLKKNTSVDQQERRGLSIEKMDMAEIEDLIFIGRKKG
jgi:hypothetical protein